MSAHVELRCWACGTVIGVASYGDVEAETAAVETHRQALGLYSAGHSIQQVAAALKITVPEVRATLGMAR